ncbi:hypothetical protein KKF81_01620 [Candidatus Micrarchaeota archaeon]|nr:hypothetical protein [Candidatus Micrarchaeota archaeon]MBU1165618.1 hypothetical protein [Candidatus Micrarchaeota archaeon]MBU1886447.1 hypothetical protein [Candidatus Micrarchaeota archaeon]
MAEEGSVEIAVPEVQNPIYIETIIEDLRKQVELNCVSLLRKAKQNADRSKAFKFGYWEEKINEIRKKHMNTSSIEELEGLKCRCNELLDKISEFDK